MSNLGLDIWRPRIERCGDLDELMHVVKAYLGAWRTEDINRLPVRLTAPIPSADALRDRAIEMIHAEKDFKGSNADWELLRDLAMVTTAAAARALDLELRPSDAQPGTGAAATTGKMGRATRQ